MARNSNYSNSTTAAASEKDRFRYAAWLVDRCSFWFLLFGYLLGAVLIFTLSSALAPGACAQFAPKQSLVDQCRATRNASAARRSALLGG